MDTEELRTFYYTFGTAETFPFQKGWVEVRAKDQEQATALFRAQFPDRTPGILNCSCVYSEKHFQTIQCMANNFEDWKICHAKISPDGMQLMGHKADTANRPLNERIAGAKKLVQAQIRESISRAKEYGR